MNTFLRFFYEFISIFFDGLYSIIKGIINGLIKMFSFNDYKQIINSYKDSFEGPEWLLVGLIIAVLVIIAGIMVFLVFFGIRKILKIRKSKIDQEDLLDEIGNLNKQVKDL